MSLTPVTLLLCDLTSSSFFFSFDFPRTFSRFSLSSSMSDSVSGSSSSSSNCSVFRSGHYKYFPLMSDFSQLIKGRPRPFEEALHLGRERLHMLEGMEENSVPPGGVIGHIFQNAQVTSNKMVQKKRHIFWQSFQHPFTWCDLFCCKCVAQKTTF